MIQNRPINAAQDEIIFSAKYSIGRVSASLVITCLFIYWWHTRLRGFAYELVQDICDEIFAGGQDLLHFLLLAPILFLLLLPLIPLVLEPLCFEAIVFYPNRVEIVRRIFRSKTVYYSNGTVEKGWLFPGYLIEEVREKGRPQRSRLLYDFYASLFSSEAGEKIETILDYLTDSSKKNPRVFKRSILPSVISFK